MQIYTKEQIEKAIDIPFLIAEIEKGLILYSKKKAIIASSSFLHFETPPGDVHIKSGAIIAEDLYVVKIASGFYDNPTLALSSSNGLEPISLIRMVQFEIIFSLGRAFESWVI